MRSLSIRLVILFSLLLVPSFALASNVTVNGTVSFSTLDGGADDQDHSNNGVFTVNGDLIINGKITCSSGGDDDHSNTPCSMKFVVSGNVVMNAGSSVLAENNRSNGDGGNITFIAGGDVTLHGPFSNQPGAVISSSTSGGGHSAAGNIAITAAGKITTETSTVITAASRQGASGDISLTAGGKIDLSGLVASGPSATLLSSRQTGAILDGGNSQQNGGQISIKSNSLFEPGITVGSNATIVSQGETDAAGPVALEGCGLIIKGLVAAILDKEGVERVVLRSGKGMTIDGTDLGVTGATTGRLGHVRADSLGNWQGKEDDDHPPAPSKTIDLFANDAIQIFGPDPALSSLYTVETTPNDKDHNQDGGRIRVISLRGTVTGSGRVFDAGEDSDSNSGGTIAISSMGDVNLDHGYLTAIGDATKLKKDAAGGNISARAYSGNVIWTSGRGDVRPVGAGASNVASQGTIVLTACGTVNISGTTFPTNGPAVGVFPTIHTGSCSPAAPTLPTGEPPLQICCNVITITNPAVTSGPAGVPFSQTFTQTGALGAPTFTLASGTLPAGLSLSASGTLSGTPTVIGTFPITVKVTDSQGCTGVGSTYNLQIVCPTIAVTNPAVTTGVAAAPFSQTFTQSGGVGATTFSLASGTLPTGLTLGANGTLSGTPLQTGSFPVTVKATDSNGCTGVGATYTLIITCQTITVTNPAAASGVAGSAFSQTFTQSGGIGTTTFSLASGTLPTGLVLGTNGTLSGTPLQTGTFPITVKATDSNGCSGTGTTYTITIACQTITVTPPAVSTGVAASPFSQTFTQTSGIGATTFTLASGTLPAGLTLAANGTLSGTPTQVGTFPITVKVTDSNGCTGTSATYNLTITCQVITVIAPAVNSGVAGSPFSQTFTQSGAIGTATFSLFAGALPTGITFSASGVLAGTPLQTGSFPITVQVTDSNGCAGTVNYTLTIACQTITVTPPAVTSGVAASPFSQTFTQSGAIGTATFTTSSALPAGLSLSAGGILSGTPTQTGTFPIIVKVTDANGCIGTASYTLTITCQTITVTSPAVTGGVAGTPFSQVFTQSGAIGTATFSLAGGVLPTGMALFTNGTLAGTPLQTGVFPITVKVTDSNGCTGTTAYTLTIACQTITVTHPAVMSGTVGVPFSQQYTQSGGIGTVTFSLTSGTLPTGMTLAADGTLSGTPMQSGSFPITVRATDSNGCFGSDSFTLTIACQTITVTNPGVTTGTVGTPFSQSFTQSGGVGTTTFSLASGTLPTGLTLAADGTLSGTPMQAGTFPITVTATDSNGCSGTGPTYTLVIACNVITVTNPANSNGTVAAPFSETFTQTGGIGTITWSESGTLPAGLTFHAGTGILDGTPTQSGSFPIAVTATDSNGCSGTGPTYTLVIACNVITVTNPGASTGTAGVPFSATFTQSGGNGTITWSESGALPAGITLNPSTGVLSGTTSQTGSFPITVTATDSNGCTGTGSTYTLVISCQTISITNPTLNSVQSGTPLSPASNWTFSATGILGSATWTIDSGTLPSGVLLNSSTGVLSGSATQVGTFPITVRVTDTNACFATSSYTLTVTCPTITITRVGGGSFPAATFNVGYPAGNQFQASCTGCTGTIHWAFGPGNGHQPPGINLTIVAGTLSGIPSATGQFTMEVVATDTGTGCSGSASFPFTIKPNVSNDSYSNLVNNTEAFVTGGTTATPATPAVQLSGAIVSNDTPASGVTVDATSVGTFATTQGGSVTIASDGTFKYTPPVTVSALSSDSFTYTGSSNTGTVPSIVQYAASTGPATATGTVTLNLANRVWYVRNSAGAGNGQSQSPFNTLSQAATSSTPNDIIFVYRGDGTSNFQNAGITLQSGQSLIGEGVALVVNGNPLVAAGVAPSIANTGGNVVTLASPAGNNTVEGLSISASSGHGIQANTLTGGINTISNVTIAATGANNGVNLINNSGSTFNVTGGLIVTSATGTGFNATGGGTVSATTTAGANTLSAAGGPAMNVVNTTIGASGLTFQSISANGGVNGIVLNNTGGLGGLTVAGDGSATRNNSGGTIQNMTGDGVVLTSTTSPSFSHMSIQNTVHNGVKGVLVTNLVFNHGSISNSGVSAGGAAVGSANDSNLSFGFPGAPLGTEQNLTGTVSIVDNALTNALYHGIDLRQFNGTVAYANISGNTLTSTTSAVTSIGTAINIGLNGGAGFASSLTKADITGNNINNFPSGSGMQLFGGNTNGTTPSNLGIQGDATNIVTITGNTLQGQSAVAQFGTTGVDFEVHGAGGGNGNINGNSISFVRGAGVIVDVGRGSATVTGSVSNNVLNTSNVLSSPGISIGLSNLVGSENASAPQLTLDVLGNTITNNNGIGILANSLRNAGTMKVKIQNNSVAAPTAAGNRAGIEVRSGGPAASTPGNTSVCTNIALNTVAGSGTFPGIGLRLQNLATATIAFGIDGLTGGGGSPATEQYVGNGVGGKNPGSANGILGTNGVLLESATTGFTACSLP